MFSGLTPDISHCLPYHLSHALLRHAESRGPRSSACCLAQPSGTFALPMAKDFLFSPQ